MKILPVIAFSIAAALASAQSTLEVEVLLDRPDAGGKVLIALCKGAEAYEEVKGCLSGSADAIGEKVIVRFTGLEPGEYAIKGMHDINGNGDMDFNILGIPTEPYGFSNDARATFSPPSFEEAGFIIVPGTTTIRFRMKD